MTKVHAWDNVWASLRSLGYLNEGAIGEGNVDFGQMIVDSVERLQQTTLTRRQINELSQLIYVVAKAAWAKQADATTPAVAELLRMSEATADTLLTARQFNNERFNLLAAAEKLKRQLTSRE